MYIVGIVGRAYQNKDGQNIMQIHEATRRFLLDRDDVICIGILPTDDKDYLDIEMGKDDVISSKLDYVLDKCDAFIVPGGTYGYSFDEYVIRYAISHDKPLLAICLGFQIMCSMFAKERIKFDMTKRVNIDRHYGKASLYQHNVCIQEGTLLKDLLNSNEIRVNSVHHDVVDFEMNDLVVNAISDDGIIEGVEYPNKKFIMGVQWHPEYLKDDYSNKIACALIDFIK